MTGKQKRAKDQPWMNKCRVCGRQATARQLVDAGAGNGWLFYCDDHQPPNLLDLLPREENTSDEATAHHQGRPDSGRA